ncbi:hypothetical protein IWQ55_006517 [Labrenzia sp. EL_208]|nr:hypothetical protein [Labrenzia sp. EL_132]MBG6233277.1 hypothetical protein [Labrenzia sp. EL_208]
MNTKISKRLIYVLFFVVLFPHLARADAFICFERSSATGRSHDDKIEVHVNEEFSRSEYFIIDGNQKKVFGPRLELNNLEYEYSKVINDDRAYHTYRSYVTISITEIIGGAANYKLSGAIADSDCVTGSCFFNEIGSCFSLNRDVND